MNEDDRRICQLALGRIFRLGSRPFQQGDIEEYERCRGIILDLSAPTHEPYRPNWVRDRLKGAPGQ